MANQQICLKWNGFHSSITTSFECLWEEQGLVDVTLASDGQCIRAHKVILSACSPFFKSVFETNPCQHPVIILQDIHFSEVESLLNFMYKGEVNIDQEQLSSLLRAAETLQIRGLSGASKQVKEKLGAHRTLPAKKKKYERTQENANSDGSPPQKRQRSILKSRSSPATPTPATVRPSRHSSPLLLEPSPQSDEPTDAAFPCHVEVIESEPYSPVGVEEVFDHIDQSNDDSMDLMAKNALLESEQLPEISNSSLTGDFTVGSVFASYNELQKAYHKWADDGHHPMTTRKSFTNPYTDNKSYPYLKLVYTCKHHGKVKARGRNIRQRRQYYANECPVTVCLVYRKKSQQYFLKELISTHNHPVSAELRSQYADRRILKGEERKAVSLLFQDNVKIETIRKIVEEQMGKVITHRDLINLKQQLKVESSIESINELVDHDYDSKHAVPSEIDEAKVTSD